MLKPMVTETTAMPQLREAVAADTAEISRLQATCFGPGRFTRTAYRVREGATSPSPISLVIETDNALVASIRLTPIQVGTRQSAMMLGPIAVHPKWANRGFGTQLVSSCIDRARDANATLILLVGDLSFFERFGFKSVPPGDVKLPGPFDPKRLLALDLKADASPSPDTNSDLDVRGLVRAA